MLVVQMQLDVAETQTARNFWETTFGADNLTGDIQICKFATSHLFMERRNVGNGIAVDMEMGQVYFFLLTLI